MGGGALGRPALSLYKTLHKIRNFVPTHTLRPTTQAATAHTGQTSDNAAKESSRKTKCKHDNTPP
eukprot:3078269-Prymnesium_polylepis.1